MQITAHSYPYQWPIYHAKVKACVHSIINHRHLECICENTYKQLIHLEIRAWTLLIGFRFAIWCAGGQGVGRSGGGHRGWGAARGQVRQNKRTVTDKNQATLVERLINPGLTLQKAGQRVQPNLSHYTVASVIWTYWNENKKQLLPFIHCEVWQVKFTLRTLGNQLPW